MSYVLSLRSIKGPVLDVEYRKRKKKEEGEEEKEKERSRCKEILLGTAKGKRVGLATQVSARHDTDSRTLDVIYTLGAHL